MLRSRNIEVVDWLENFIDTIVTEDMSNEVFTAHTLPTLLLANIIGDSDTAVQFFDKVEQLKAHILLDAWWLKTIDPAATSVDEVIRCYPGFYATLVYRISHTLYNGNRVVARVMSEHAHGKTGIDIHPGAEIGVPFGIDHGTGVVIGETAVVGKNVVIYQGVTLGALRVDTPGKRHPTIGNNVTIYANASVFGSGKVEDGTIIKANSTIIL